MLRHLLFRRARICSSRLGSKRRLVEKHHEWPRPVVCGPDKRHISCLCVPFRDIHAHRGICFDMGKVCVIDVFIPCSKELYCMLLYGDSRPWTTRHLHAMCARTWIRHWCRALRLHASGRTIQPAYCCRFITGYGTITVQKRRNMAHATVHAMENVPRSKLL